MKIVYQISNEYNIFPNMTVYERVRDGAIYGWKIEANEGYKLFNPNNIEKIFNPMTMEEETIVAYLQMVSLPKNFNWNTFSYEAVEVTE